MVSFENRKQQRKVIEEMDALLMSLKNFVTDDMKECITVTHRILHETPVSQGNIDNKKFSVYHDEDRFQCSVCHRRDNKYR